MFLFFFLCFAEIVLRNSILETILRKTIQLNAKHKYFIVRNAIYYKCNNDDNVAVCYNIFCLYVYELK